MFLQALRDVPRRAVLLIAVAVGLGAFALARRRTMSALDLPMQLPTASSLDARLVGGSIVFGIGWGLAGFCPAPAIVALGAGYPKAAVFVAAMLLGMVAFELIQRNWTRVDLTSSDARSA